MKLCRYDQSCIGIVEGDRVFDITEEAAAAVRASPSPGRGDPLITALPQLKKRLPASLETLPSKLLPEVALRSPVMAPSKIIAAPVNYKAHIEEMMNSPAASGHALRDIDKAGLFLKANSSLAGPSEGVPIRFPQRRTDYEVELVAIIGKPGSDISRSEALSYVAGYCLGIDITLRGTEDRSFRKSMDGYSIAGPWFVSADEIPDPDNLEISLSINGELRQRANTRDMVFGVARLIEYASSFYTLHPGDLLYTGTPQGVGPIRPGDVIQAAGDGLGTMRISVRAHAAGTGV